jgi:NTE family protein
MRSQILLVSFLAVIILSPTFAKSQEPAPTPQRPRIGLVLEGGAALGLAHIGVLQWLE